MACLSCNFITKTPLRASLTSNENISNSPSLQSTTNLDPPIPNTKPKPTLPRKSKVQQHLNLIRIERAVGAGSYRDNEPRGSEQKKSTFKGMLSHTDGALEGSVEKRLRETGEWVTEKTEGGFQSNGKRILMFTFQGILPTYILLFLLAAGIVKLPFDLPLLDDLFL